MPAIPILRRLALAAALVLPASLAAQAEVRVMPFGAFVPFFTAQAGVHVELSPGGGDWSVFAEYEGWVWGFTCHEPFGNDDDRCGDSGNGFHAGVTRHLADRSAGWRPYVTLGAGYAEPTGDDDPGPSVLGEGGFDLGGARGLTVRLGVRWHGRPGAGTDFVGPLVGLRLRL